MGLGMEKGKTFGFGLLMTSLGQAVTSRCCFCRQDSNIQGTVQSMPRQSAALPVRHPVIIVLLGEYGRDRLPLPPGP